MAAAAAPALCVLRCLSRGTAASLMHLGRYRRRQHRPRLHALAPQTQQRRQAIAARLQAQGIAVTWRQQGRQEEEEDPLADDPAPPAPPELEGSSPGPGSLASRQQLLPAAGQRAAAQQAEPEQPASAAAANGAAAAAGKQGGAEQDARFHAWMRDVCAGCCRPLCLAPSRWGAELAPQLSPQQAAEIYTGVERGLCGLGLHMRALASGLPCTECCLHPGCRLQRICAR